MKKLNKIIRNLSSKVSSLAMAFLFFILKEDETMSLVYVSLIIKGRKTFAQVPDKLKPEVRQYLIDMELEYLIEE